MGWFVCIIGAAWNSTYQALIIASVIVAAHLLLTSKNSSDIKLIVIAAVIGFIFDGLIQINSLIVYNDPGIPYPFTPLWIVMLWVLFSITLNHSMSWLKGRFILSAIFGGIGGPLAYIAGEKLMAITIVHSYTFIVLSVGWALITPLLILCGDKK